MSNFFFFISFSFLAMNIVNSSFLQLQWPQPEYHSNRYRKKKFKRSGIIGWRFRTVESSTLQSILLSDVAPSRLKLSWTYSEPHSVKIAAIGLGGVTCGCSLVNYLFPNLSILQIYQMLIPPYIVENQGHVRVDPLTQTEGELAFPCQLWALFTLAALCFPHWAIGTMHFWSFIGRIIPAVIFQFLWSRVTVGFRYYFNPHTSGPIYEWIQFAPFAADMFAEAYRAL